MQWALLSRSVKEVGNYVKGSEPVGLHEFYGNRLWERGTRGLKAANQGKQSSTPSGDVVGSFILCSHGRLASPRPAPRSPLLHHLLCTLGRPASFAAPIKIYILVHALCCRDRRADGCETPPRSCRNEIPGPHRRPRSVRSRPISRRPTHLVRATVYNISSVNRSPHIWRGSR